MRWTVVAGVVLLALAASASTAAAAVSGSWSRADGSATVNASVKNDGPGNISKLVVTVQGARMTSVSSPSPPGEVLPTDSDGSTGSGFEYIPNEPVAPGATMAFSFQVNAEPTGVVVRESNDGGATYGPETALTKTAPGEAPPPEDPPPSDDAPRVNGSWAQASSDTLNVYVTNNGPGSITQLQLNIQGADVMGGEATPPGPMGPTDDDPSAPKGNITYFPSSAIAPGGTVRFKLVVVGRASGVLARASADGGTTFGTRRALTQRCRCANLKLAAKRLRVKRVAGGRQISFRLNWLLDCTGGTAGSDCVGTFRVNRPRKRVSCKSAGATCADARGRVLIRRRVTGLKPVNFTIARTCGGVKKRTHVVKVVFDKRGRARLV